VIEKMVEGRIRKFYEEVVLLEQVWVHDGESRVKQVVHKAGLELRAGGGNLADGVGAHHAVRHVAEAEALIAGEAQVDLGDLRGRNVDGEARVGDGRQLDVDAAGAVRRDAGDLTTMDDPAALQQIRDRVAVG